MKDIRFQIIEFDNSKHRKQVVDLWENVFGYNALLSHAQVELENLGCIKINLQIMEGNEAVQKFYLDNGYSVEQRISMGKKLY